MDPSTESCTTFPRLEGRYANHFAVGFNEYEFVLDFGQSHFGSDRAEPCIRVITGPAYAKSFMQALAESIAQYEEKFGVIEKA